MKRIHTIGLALLAVLAFSAIAVASASATEVLFKLTSGKFPATFSSKGGEAKLETTAGNTIICKEVTNKGEIGSATEGGGTRAHLGKVEIKFKGCKSKEGVLNVECKSGSTKEEIVVPSAEYHLGLLAPGDEPSILILLPGATVSNPLGGTFSFKCSIVSVEVKGDVVGKLEGGIEKPLKSTNLVFTQSAKGKQSFTEFLLSLTSPENELMTGQHLTTKTKLFTTEESESGETATDTLEGFKNSASEATEIELVKG